MGERRGVYKAFGGETPSERDYLKNPGIGGRITLRWIFKKWNGGHELDLSSAE